jgi:GNAT superfamily N-acetyltransferase
MQNAAAIKTECHLREDVLSSDRESVRNIVASTGFFRPDEIEVAVELVDERLAKGIDSGYLFVFAEIASQIAGYACYGPIACTAASYDLYWIAVAPRWQRGGLGQKLMAEVEQLVVAAGGERIYIDTSGKPQYVPTCRFYERCGYQIAAQLPDFYALGDDRLIYVKAISDST